MSYAECFLIRVFQIVLKFIIENMTPATTSAFSITHIHSLKKQCVYTVQAIKCYKFVALRNFINRMNINMTERNRESGTKIQNIAKKLFG